MRTEKDFKGFEFLLVLFVFLDYVSNMTILICSFLLGSYQFLQVLLNSPKGVHPHMRCLSTKLPKSTDQFPFGSTLHLSSTRDKG